MLDLHTINLIFFGLCRTNTIFIVSFQRKIVLKSWGKKIHITKIYCNFSLPKKTKVLIDDIIKNQNQGKKVYRQNH